MEIEELGRQPRHVWAGGGGLPDGGQDYAPQAGEAHGCKRRGTVMLMSTKDTGVWVQGLWLPDRGPRTQRPGGGPQVAARDTL